MTAAISTPVEDQLAKIQSQLASISEELAIIRRTRDEIRDLKDDLTIVVRDLFQTTVKELEEVSPFVQTGEFAELFKKLLRNAGNFNELLRHLESANDFVKDIQPIGKEIFGDTLEKLHELDGKGYFRYFSEIQKILDNVVTHFTVQDVRLLADNIVSILEAVKNLTQPEIIHALNNAAVIFKKLDLEKVEEYSLWRVIKEANSSEMRRAWGIFYSFMKNLSQEFPKIKDS